MNHILDLFFTFLKQLIFEEVPNTETPKETLQRKITSARNNISAGKLGFVLLVGIAFLVILIVIIRLILSSDTEKTASLILLSALFFIAGYLLDNIGETVPS